MKKFLTLSLSLFLSFGALAQALSGDKLKFETSYELEAYKGQTYLSLMQEEIKPALDKYAEEGFAVTDAKTVNSLFSNGAISSKVAKGALKDAGTKEELLSIVKKLNQKNEMVTFYDLPQEIRAAATGRVDIYGLSTFIALASGGGVAVKINEENFFYNVNYGTGKVDKDVQTGRSFGASPARGADDASDANYLRDLQKYVTTESNPATLYKTILEMVLNCDPSGYEKLSELGQSIATDFIAVYTAEQDRKLMDFIKKRDWNRSLNWDEALLEVTLISALHAGQDKIQVMFNGVFTDVTLKQAPGGSERSQFQPASLVDWWQFTSNPDPKNRNRSGINITRRDFTALGKAISDYERAKNPAVVSKLEAVLGSDREQNLFRKLSNYIINLKTPKKLGAKAYSVAKEFTAFLMQVKKDANAISAKIKKDQGDIKVEPIKAYTELR